VRDYLLSLNSPERAIAGFASAGPASDVFALGCTLAFAATADRPTAVLTGPAAATGSRAWPLRQSRPAGICGLVRGSLQTQPRPASAALFRILSSMSVTLRMNATS